MIRRYGCVAESELEHRFSIHKFLVGQDKGEGEDKGDKGDKGDGEDFLPCPPCRFFL